MILLKMVSFDKHTHTHINFVAFAVRINPRQFDRQKSDVSPLISLCDSVVDDPKMSLVDKKKFLVNFQKQYPDIYATHGFKWKA
jgi:hypothetical protein